MGPEDDAAPRRRVRFDSTGEQIWLERHEPVSVDGRWQLVWRGVCVAPCTIDVPVTGLYRVRGPGLMGSGTFRLPEGEGDTHVEARLRSSTGWGLGLAGTIVGGGFVFTGIPLLLSARSCDESKEPDCKRVLQESAVFSFAFGALLCAGGFYLLLRNTSDVSLTQVPRPMARSRPSLLGLTIGPEGIEF